MKIRILILLFIWLNRPVIYASDIQVQLYAWPRSGLLSSDSAIEHIPEIELRSGPSAIPFRVARGVVGPAVTVPHTGNFKFHRREGDGAVKDSDINNLSGSTLYFEVNIPASWSNAVIVFFPERRVGGGRVEANVLNLDPQRVRPGIGTFFNGTSTPLQMVIRNEVYTLPPYGTLALPRRNLEERIVNGNARFGAQLFYQDEEGRWRQSYNGVQYVRSDSVNLFWIHSSASGRSHRMRPLRTSVEEK